MTPQLSAQQIEHATKNLEARVKAKTLECSALDRMRELAGALAVDSFVVCADEESRDAVRQTVADYFTARLNFELVNLEEFELQLKAVRSMRSGVIVPGLMNHVPPGRQ